MPRIAPTLGALAALAAAAPATAQVTVDVQLSVATPEIGVGQVGNFELRIDVNGADIDEVQEPDFTGFRVSRRQVSTPRMFRVGFGGPSRVVQLTRVYRYQVLGAVAGSYEIPPAVVTVAGRRYRSNPVEVRVVQHSPDVVVPTTAPPQPPDPLGVPASDPAGPADPDLSRMAEGAEYDTEAFLRTVVDKADPYVGEQVTMTVYLYSRGPVRSSPIITREPTAEGFWVHDLLPPQRTLEATRQRIHGNDFHVYVLRRWAVFPLREGALTIGPMELTIQTGSLIDLFGRGRQQLRRTGQPVGVAVRPLPAPAPPGGVVGRWELTARLDRVAVQTGDAATLTVLARARRGNVTDLHLSLPAMDGLRVLAPQTRDHVENPRDVVGGARTFEWLLIPERPGRFVVPALSADVFDPVDGTWSRASTTPLTLTAAGAALTPDPGPARPEPRGDEDDEEPAERFGPVRARSALSRRRPDVSSSALYRLALAAPPLAFLLLVVVGQTRRRAERRAATEAPRRAVRSARKRLARARALAQSEDAGAFYGEVASVLRAVLEARLGEPIGGLTHDRLRDHLVERGMDEDLARAVTDELEGSDFARFSASGAAREGMDRCASRVGDLLERLDAFRPAAPEDGA